MRQFVIIIGVLTASASAFRAVDDFDVHRDVDRTVMNYVKEQLPQTSYRATSSRWPRVVSESVKVNYPGASYPGMQVASVMAKDTVRQDVRDHYLPGQSIRQQYKASYGGYPGNEVDYKYSYGRQVRNDFQPQVTKVINENYKKVKELRGDGFDQDGFSKQVSRELIVDKQQTVPGVTHVAESQVLVDQTLGGFGGSDVKVIEQNTELLNPLNYNVYDRKSKQFIQRIDGQSPVASYYSSYRDGRYGPSVQNKVNNYEVHHKQKEYYPFGPHGRRDEVTETELIYDVPGLKEKKILNYEVNEVNELYPNPLEVTKIKNIGKYTVHDNVKIRDLSIRSVVIDDMVQNINAYKISLRELQDAGAEIDQSYCTRLFGLLRPDLGMKERLRILSIARQGPLSRGKLDWASIDALPDNDNPFLRPSYDTVLNKGEKIELNYLDEARINDIGINSKIISNEIIEEKKSARDGILESNWEYTVHPGTGREYIKTTNNIYVNNDVNDIALMGNFLMKDYTRALSQAQTIADRLRFLDTYGKGSLSYKQNLIQLLNTMKFKWETMRKLITLVLKSDTNNCFVHSGVLKKMLIDSNYVSSGYPTFGEKVYLKYGSCRMGARAVNPCEECVCRYNGVSTCWKKPCSGWTSSKVLFEGK